MNLRTILLIVSASLCLLNYGLWAIYYVQKIVTKRKAIKSDKIKIRKVKEVKMFTVTIYDTANRNIATAELESKKLAKKFVEDKSVDLSKRGLPVCSYDIVPHKILK